MMIRNIIKYATEHVPFYKGINPLSSLSDMPIITKKMIQANPNMFKSDEAGIIPYIEVSSSGSTGMPLTVLKTHDQICLELDEFLEECDLHQVDLQSKYAIIRAGATIANYDHWLFVHPSIKTGPSCVIPSSTDVVTQLLWLNKHQPRYLLTHPSNLKELVKVSFDVLKPTSLEFVRTIGEPVTDALRKMVRNAWGIEIIDLYSSRECGRIAYQCPHEPTKYHIQNDNVFVEVLNERNENCLPGEIGRVVVTCLESYLMPLIRYENGDYAEVGQTCPCLNNSKTLRRIIGRERNMITLSDGTKHWPSFPSEEWTTISQTIRQFKLIQHTVDDIEVQLVCDYNLAPIQEIQIGLMLNRRFSSEFEYNFTYLNELQIGKNGKFEDFVSNVNK